MPKRSQPDLSGGTAHVSRSASPWHAVSIVLCHPCCKAAGAASVTRYLSDDAPRLPLAACTTPDSCACYYKHYSDRRAQPRRRDELVGLRRKGYGAQERRRLRGRREDDMS
jgi:hypothetical protein